MDWDAGVSRLSVERSRNTAYLACSEADADGKSLEFTYTYDDGPKKVVSEISMITIEPAGNRFTITSDRDSSSDNYQMGDRRQGPGERIQFNLTGIGKENDKSVEVRITVMIDRNIYRFKKETRLAGQEFAFRDGYTFTRRTPPGM